jgi:hypothetical protein
LKAAPQYEQPRELTRIERIGGDCAGPKAELVRLIVIGRAVTVQ